MITGLATLAQELKAASREFRIIPAGMFRSNDGRPEGLPGWKMDGVIAAQIIADLNGRDDLVIDYDHQTLLLKQNGQPAPAAGWFKRVVWRESQGLYATDVKWTDKARAMLSAGEYRYISPVFSFSEVTGKVERLFSLALTNNPGLTKLTDLSTVALNSGQPATRPRDSDHSIHTFNHAFGSLGVFHPETPTETIAKLTGTAPKPKFPQELLKSDPEGAAALRHAFPGTWQD